jgi:hypothetical protein
VQIFTPPKRKRKKTKADAQPCFQTIHHPLCNIMTFNPTPFVHLPQYFNHLLFFDFIGIKMIGFGNYTLKSSIWMISIMNYTDSFRIGGILCLRTYSKKSKRDLTPMSK